MPRDSRIGGFGSDRIRKSGSNLDQGFGGGKVKSVGRGRGLGNWDNPRRDRGNPSLAGDNRTPARADVLKRGVGSERGGKDRRGHQFGGGHKGTPKPSGTMSNPLK